MKKYLTGLFILFAVLIPFSVFADDIVMVLQAAVGGASCDDCSGNLIYSHHAENNDDATVGTPPLCGCSDSATYKSWTLTGATYSDVQKHDGSYSILCNGAGHRAAIDNTDNWLGIEITGTWKGWVYLTSDEDLRIASLANSILVSFISATDVIRLAYGAGFQDSSITIAQNTWTYVECGWDASQAAGSDKLRVKITATEAASTTLTLTNQAAQALSYIIGNLFQNEKFYIDEVELWSSYDGT